MRVLNNVKLEDLINKTASTVQRELSQMTPDPTGNELFTIREEVSPKTTVLWYSSEVLICRISDLSPDRGQLRVFMPGL